MIWSLVALGIMVLVLYALVVALRAALRRNERLTMMLAVREAHGGKGTDAARAHVATIKELNKKYADAAAAGLVPPAEERKKKGKHRLLGFVAPGDRGLIAVCGHEVLPEPLEDR